MTPTTPALPPGLPAGLPPGLQLHLIEPQLVDEAGHCHSLVSALASAAAQRLDAGRQLTIWSDRRAAGLWHGPGRLQPHFGRRLRRWQMYRLLRRLLRQPADTPVAVLLATAGTTDLWLADRAAGPALPAGRLHAFVHWLNAKAGKADLLSAIARRQPRLQVLAPTAEVARFFSGCGFAGGVVPYPVGPAALPAPAGTEADPATDPATDPRPGADGAAADVCRHLLVPGGARLDKGFAHIVDLACALHRLGDPQPLRVQTSLEDRQRDNAALAAQLARLAALDHPPLTRVAEAPEAAAYAAQFRGAIVLQPYAAADFRDRVSGVTLDALAAGAPVVVTAGTWMARLVERFGAGVATADLSPAGLLAAIDTVRRDYPAYARRARAAAAQVRDEHSAQRLIDVVLGLARADAPPPAAAPAPAPAPAPATARPDAGGPA